MRALISVAAGGAVGASGRHLVYLAATEILGAGFPFGTLTVNVVGSFAMGVLAAGMALIWTVGPQLRLFLAVGVLGGFTTFSAFAYDVAKLHHAGETALLLLYVLASVLCSVGGLFLGLLTVRRIAKTGR